MVAVDRLSDLPDSLLIHILSMLTNPKEVVRTCLLSKQWRFLWKSVSLSLCYINRGKNFVDFAASINRELCYWRSCHKIRKFAVESRYKKLFDRDVDRWVHFATQTANVEYFSLRLINENINVKYDFPQYAYKNTSLTHLVLYSCTLNPVGSVSWSSLVSLSIGYLKLNDGVMEKVLSGCPNLKCLKIDLFWGLNRLEISSRKLRKLIISNNLGTNATKELQIFAPYIENLQVLGFRTEICLRLRNVASLVSAVLHFNTYYGSRVEEDDLEEYKYVKELLESLAHVEKLELGPWCIKFLSVLELKGLQPPPSSRKCLTIGTALKHVDFPGIHCLLQSSPDLETLVITWSEDYWPQTKLISEFINEDEFNRRFQTHCSLLHLKTIKIIHFNGPLSENKFLSPLVKYLLNNAKVLERIVIAASLCDGSDVSQYFVEMALEFLNFPRSSPHVTVLFSYQ